MMILAFFLSKELSCEIVKLQKKNNLNLQVLRQVKFQIFLWPLCFTISAVFIYSIAPFIVFVVFSAILLPFCIIGMFMEINCIRKRALSYHKGELRRAIVQSLSAPQHGSAVYARAFIEDVETGEVFRIGPFINWHKQDNYPKKNDIIEYYSQASNSEKMPNDYFLKQCYCLSLQTLRNPNSTDI